MTVKGRGSQSRNPPAVGAAGTRDQAALTARPGAAGPWVGRVAAGAGGHPALQLYLMAVKVQLRE